MSSANLRSSNDRPPSRKSKPKCSISSRQFAIDISNTEQNSRGLKTHPCRTPPCISKDLLQPLLPTTCPCWFRYKLWIIQIMCSERPCSERARHSVGQCTRSKAFDKSRLTIQIGTFALESLSKTKCVVTKCSSTRLPPRKPCCSSRWCVSNWAHPSQNHETWLRHIWSVMARTFGWRKIAMIFTQVPKWSRCLRSQML